MSMTCCRAAASVPRHDSPQQPTPCRCAPKLPPCHRAPQLHSQIWELQRSAAGGSLGGGSGSGRASGRAPKPSAKAIGKEPPRAVITGMEGLEARFRGADVYPAYQPGAVQAMHSG